jgi:hypothetical protein
MRLRPFIRWRKKFKSRHQSLSQPLMGFDVVTSRDGRTAIELFLAAVRGWEARLHRQINDETANPD